MKVYFFSWLDWLGVPPHLNAWESRGYNIRFYPFLFTLSLWRTGIKRKCNASLKDKYLHACKEPPTKNERSGVGRLWSCSQFAKKKPQKVRPQKNKNKKIKF